MTRMSAIVPGWRIVETPERNAVVVHRNAVRAALAAALDPAMIEAAARVCDALHAEQFAATQATDEKAHCVAVRHVTSADLSSVDAITQRAAKPFFGECRQFQSYITITVKGGRAIEMHERWLRRRGEDGVVVTIDADGALAEQGVPDQGPLVALGYDDV